MATEIHMQQDEITVCYFRQEITIKKVFMVDKIYIPSSMA